MVTIFSVFVAERHEVTIDKRRSGNLRALVWSFYTARLMASTSYPAAYSQSRLNRDTAARRSPLLYEDDRATVVWLARQRPAR
jgi:hypothetical protein